MQNTLVNPKKDSHGYDPFRFMAKASPGLALNWTWVMLICLLLGVSGGVRHWRDWKFQSLSKESENPPFPLKELPKTLGSWREIEEAEIQLDPQIARIAGSNDHVIRTYSDEKSGESVTVLVLYGLANIVFAHTPEVCYPAAGFRPVKEMREIDVPIPDSSDKAKFRSQVYGRLKIGGSIYEEAYYSFLYNGKWWTDPSNEWKSFRYHPGMFKVQVQHRVGSGGAKDSPVEELLGNIVKEIEQRLAAKSPSSNQAKPSTAAASF
jgi:hypothetical protein